MAKYDHKKIESLWQKKWEEKEVFKTDDNSKKNKYYVLFEFPYPSGDGLHIGHVRTITATDIIARKRRAEGHEVLYPVGWDAFGLPTENYAVRTGIHPKIATKENTDNFRKQLKSLGVSFDWSREINTTDPEYYKWTQWIFLKLHEKGLAYKAKKPINWCLSCKIGLANEEVVAGKCERCEGDIEERQMEQWMLAITKYADKLESQLDDVDYIEPVKIQQRNWIGKSIGADIIFKVKNSDKEIKVFTTRPDTLFGVTYMVLAPEHQLVGLLKDKIENLKDVERYIGNARKKSELERVSEEKEKTGVELRGVKAINPVNKKDIPIWIADYVLADYGTGAIMAVPAHDERDYEFAKKFGLAMVEVISGGDIKKEAYIGEGGIVNSGEFNGTESSKAKIEITKFADGEEVIRYKLRDWIFSRQRYWGEPIPMIHCKACGIVPVPLEDLPVELPDIKDFKPRDDGRSPLASAEEWVNTKCPKCGGGAERETDVMPNWAGSSWYFLRYTDPKNDKELAGKDKLKHYMPVDWYNGGMEHTTLHLLYSRFWNNFLYDIGVVPYAEPYKKRTSHGMVLGEGGIKMSKSKGNVVNPDEMTERFGADTLRVYEMFMGPFDQAIAWSTDNMVGVRRFLERVWGLLSDPSKLAPSSENLGALHKTIKKVSEDIEGMRFNTAVSQLMIFMNETTKKGISKEEAGIFLKLIAPFAPHIAEELWQKLGNNTLICVEPWPLVDDKYLKDEKVTIAIQVNGKVRDSIVAEPGLGESQVKDKALATEKIKKWTDGKDIKKVIYVQNKILNIVI